MKEIFYYLSRPFYKLYYFSSLVFIIGFIGFFSGVFLGEFDLFKIFIFIEPYFSNIIFFLIFIVGIIGMLYSWIGLSNNRLRVNSLEDIANAERQVSSSVESTIRKSEYDIKSIISEKVSEINKNSDKIIRDEITQKINNNFSNNITSSLGAHILKTSSEFEKKQTIKLDVNAIFSDIVRRPLSYADAANRQATTYKFIAIFLSVLGLLIALLGLWKHYEIFYMKGGIWPDPPNLWAALWRHAPLFSVVILTEFLALILFRYATKSQETMKYFANEAVNFQAKQAALLIVLNIGTDKQIVEAANNLGRIERNTILKGGERTVEKDSMEDESSFVDNMSKNLNPLRSTSKAASAVKASRVKS